jgi:hypothetical protein
VSVTGTVNGLIVDGVVAGHDGTAVVNGPASHLERYDVTFVGEGESGAGGHSDATAGAQTIAWTLSGSAGWVQVAVNVKSAIAPGPSTATIFCYPSQ